MNIDHLPAALRTEFTRLWANVPIELQQQIEQNTTLCASLPTVWACSPFVAKNCTQKSALLTDLVSSGDLLREPDNYLDHLQQHIPADADEAQLQQILRHYRRREMVRIAWRDLAGWADLSENLRCLSNLADALVEAALQHLYRTLCQRFGTPYNASGQAQQLVVLGMGKLGGRELNFSSDIDLIFIYPEAGETQGGTGRSRDNQTFFVRLGQQLINALNTNTADGFVYRVDMRLRPFGDSGPLVMNFDAAEEYYQSHARDWERYALVKARVVAGDHAAGKELLAMLRPFIYRRYLDYNAYEALRTMKALIDQETQRKGLENNIKLGPGGIREVEFTCQVFQLIRGGRQPALQERHLLTVLQRLHKFGLFDADSKTKLEAAYCFLRRAENHLQAINDQQTQTLPDDELNQTRLAFSFDFATWQTFLDTLVRHQTVVQQHFHDVMKPNSAEQSTASDANLLWQHLWHSGLHDEQVARDLLQSVFADPEAVLQALRNLNQANILQRMSSKGRERLDRLVPLVIEACLQHNHADFALIRILGLLEAVVLRSVYLALMLERPQVLQQLVRLFADSAWIAEQVTRYPLLLDELLDIRRLYQPLQPDEMDEALQAQLAQVPLDDMELQMDSMRQFKRACVLHVASAELTGHLSVEVASDYLAAVADTLLRRALTLAWQQMTAKHGVPQCRDEGVIRKAGFCIVAYGKAGGIELSYSSDLDIVFLHNSRGEAQLTDGRKSLDNNVFFARLAQRIIHILTTNTAAGTLYEVDPRLRPGGASGLLVSSMDAFIKYQRDEAWTWEHQALVRARGVAGEADCLAQFEHIRHDTLLVPREATTLREAVVEMRQKMRTNLDKSNAEKFDLKQGHGGIADIEFIVQYGVLRWAQAHPELVETTGVLPALQRFAVANLLDAQCCAELSDAYRRYRLATHHHALRNEAAMVPASAFINLRAQVQQCWERVMGCEPD